MNRICLSLWNFSSIRQKDAGYFTETEKESVFLWKKLVVISSEQPKIMALRFQSVLAIYLFID